MRDFTEEERIGAVAPLAGRTRWSRAEGVLLIAAGVGVLADSFAHLAPAGIVAAAGFGFAGLSGLLLTVWFTIRRLRRRVNP